MTRFIFGRAAVGAGLLASCLAIATCREDGGDAGEEIASPDGCLAGRLDPATGLCWQDPPAEIPNPQGWDDLVSRVKWRVAHDYCAGLELGGHDDWRLPSREDFTDLLGGCGKVVLEGGVGWCRSCAESERCTALFGDDRAGYWTSTLEAEDRVWMVCLSHGYVLRYYIMDHYRVRCVRGPWGDVLFN